MDSAGTNEEIIRLYVRLPGQGNIRGKGKANAAGARKVVFKPPFRELS